MRRTSVLDGLSTPCKHSRGLRVDECDVGHRSSEEVLGSGVDLWIDERSVQNQTIMASVLLTLMTMYPFQFRFADTKQYVLGSPPTLIDWLPSWLITLTFFRCEGNVAVVPGRDQNRMSARSRIRCGFYFTAVVIFTASACFGRRRSRWQILEVAGMLLSAGTARHLCELVVACRVRLDGGGKA